jgi:hypothetical protein
MFNVMYEKSDVLKSWFATSIERRKELLTYKDTNLIALVNCINTSLVLAANSSKSRYEVLESIDTYWTEPIYMQIKPSLVKGLKFFKLLQDKYPSFLEGKKVLYINQNDYIKIFDTETSTWENFQLIICRLIEQGFLLSHFEKLNLIAEKATQLILDSELKLKQKAQKIKEKVPEKPWFDSEDFLVEISSDNSTDTDEKDLNYIFYESEFFNSKSHTIRKYYSTKTLDWDEEVNEILNQAYYEFYPFEYLPNFPVVRYYTHPNRCYLQDN